MILRKMAYEWVAENPILSFGQVGQEIDTLRLKIGNGVDQWDTLLYNTSISISSNNVVITPVSQMALRNVLIGLVPSHSNSYAYSAPRKGLPVSLPYSLGS